MAATHVILFKDKSDESGEDRYEAALSSLGLDCGFVPVLTFRRINVEALCERLRNTEEPLRGVIVTSPRGSEAVADALRAVDGDSRTLCDRLVFFAVGCFFFRQTARPLRTLGCSVLGAESGTADALMAEFLEWAGDHPSDHPWLFASGTNRRETVPAELNAAGTRWEEMPVYETSPTDSLTLARRVTDASPPDAPPLAMVFFSPSGVRATQQLALRRSWMEKGACCVAIGPTTLAALECVGAARAMTAESPTPEGVRQCIERLME